MPGETKVNQNKTCIRIASVLAKVLNTGPHEAVIPTELQCYSKTGVFSMTDSVIGLTYIHHKKRGHFPYISHQK
jgi:hypothetical protein